MKRNERHISIQGIVAQHREVVSANRGNLSAEVLAVRHAAADLAELIVSRAQVKQLRPQPARNQAPTRR